jgi:RES domain-containing protein
VIAEAYRHLVEEGGIDPQMVKPRSFYEVDVAIEEVVDLTDRNNLERVGLTLDDVMSAVDDYDACQDVAAVAHQLGRHGILAPAATRLGTTLAIFRERVSIAELPVPVEETTWTHLPPDPRELRLVEKSSRQSSPAPPS